MRIISTAMLTAEQTAAIQRLHERCAACDGAVHRLTLDTGMNLDPQMDAFYLAYEGAELAGFVPVYHGDVDEAEIAGFTSPRHRRRGVFTALLAKAAEQLRIRGVRRLLLQSNPAVPSGPAALAAMGLGISFSEYIMVWRLDALPEADGRLALHAAKPDELEAVCELAGSIFKDNPAFYRAFMAKALAAEDMTVYTAQLGDDTIGLCRMIWSETPPYLCTFGIRPDSRGRGLGESLLGLMLAQAAARGFESVTLDVNSENASALTLYRKAGFHVISQIDYYEMLLYCSDS